MAYRHADGHATIQRHWGWRRRPPVPPQDQRSPASAWVGRVFLAILLITGLMVGPASAAVTVATVPVFPATAVIGQAPQPATITVQNRSAAPGAGQLILSMITLVPSCGAIASGGDCPAGAADPGVFQLSATGAGELGTACGGVAFAITMVDPGQGKVQFVAPNFVAPIVLATPGSRTDSCRIDFTIKAIKLPTKDAEPGVPGVQTTQLGASFGTQQNGAPGGGVGSSVTTVTRVHSTIVAKVAATAAIGVPLTDTATLAADPAPAPPSGSITFKVFGPVDADCMAAPVFTSTKRVNRAGTYLSDPFAPTVVGTYRFVAAYDGDADTDPSATTCRDTAQVSTVGRASPGIATTVSQPVGGRISELAVLAGAVTPTGSVEFRVYGPNNDTCSGPPLATVARPVDANATASGEVSVTKPGFYRVVASYSGDTNNNSVASACNETRIVVGPDVTKQVQAHRPSHGGWLRPIALVLGTILLLLVVALLFAARRRSQAVGWTAPPGIVPVPVGAAAPAPLDRTETEPRGAVIPGAPAPDVGPPGPAVLPGRATQGVATGSALAGGGMGDGASAGGGVRDDASAGGDRAGVGDGISEPAMVEGGSAKTGREVTTDEEVPPLGVRLPTVASPVLPGGMAEVATTPPDPEVQDHDAVAKETVGIPDIVEAEVADPSLASRDFPADGGRDDDEPAGMEDAIARVPDAGAVDNEGVERGIAAGDVPDQETPVVDRGETRRLVDSGRSYRRGSPDGDEGDGRALITNGMTEAAGPEVVLQQLPDDPSLPSDREPPRGALHVKTAVPVIAGSAVAAYLLKRARSRWKR